MMPIYMQELCQTAWWVMTLFTSNQGNEPLFRVRLDQLIIIPVFSSLRCHIRNFSPMWTQFEGIDRCTALLSGGAATHSDIIISVPSNSLWVFPDSSNQFWMDLWSGFHIWAEERNRFTPSVFPLVNIYTVNFPSTKHRYRSQTCVLH